MSLARRLDRLFVRGNEFTRDTFAQIWWADSKVGSIKLLFTDLERSAEGSWLADCIKEVASYGAGYRSDLVVEQVKANIKYARDKSSVPTSLKITLGSHSFSQRSASLTGQRAGTLPAMAGRRGWGEDSIYFDHSGECRDPEAHRHCPGRWRGVVSLKPGPDGQRRRKKVSGKNKTEVRAKLAELHDELDEGIVTNASYTVAHAIEDWLARGGACGRSRSARGARPGRA